MKPGYLNLHKSGELGSRSLRAMSLLSDCNVCPHACGVNRLLGTAGKCFSGELPIVASYTRHMGEEPVISGYNGAGNIFFGNCNMKCIYCQNHEISQDRKTDCCSEIGFERLAEIMLELQSSGCHNIGLVSPSHFVPQILKSLDIAAGQGLELPLIWNSNGYDSLQSLHLLDGVIDIYLPDFKYGNDDYALAYSKAPGYFSITGAAITEMHRQMKGDFIIGADGVLKRGMIVRHLVLPNDLAESENIFKFLVENIGTNIRISLMSQYYPVHNANREILLSRKITGREYEKAVELLHRYGLTQGWIQELESCDYYRPQFIANRDNPFGN